MRSSRGRGHDGVCRETRVGRLGRENRRAWGESERAWHARRERRLTLDVLKSHRRRGHGLKLSYTRDGGKMVRRDARESEGEKRY